MTRRADIATKREHVTQLIAIKNIRTAVPTWPYSEHGTWRLIRLGRLGCVHVGRNRFVTAKLLEDCITAHLQPATVP